jgi:PAS domain S-box-containing protein
MVLTYVSPSIFNVLGWKAQEIIGTGPEALVLAEDLPVLAATHAHNLTQGVESRPATVRMRKKDGSAAWMEISARVVRDPATEEPTETIIVMRDISERKALEAQLYALALTDGLTGLSNRFCRVKDFSPDNALIREAETLIKQGSHRSSKTRFWQKMP